MLRVLRGLFMGAWRAVVTTYDGSHVQPRASICLLNDFVLYISKSTAASLKRPSNVTRACVVNFVPKSPMPLIDRTRTPCVLRSQPSRKCCENIRIKCVLIIIWNPYWTTELRSPARTHALWWQIAITCANTVGPSRDLRGARVAWYVVLALVRNIPIRNYFVFVKKIIHFPQKN